ncbi:hypothetical protein [Nitrospirillum iridis]|uniref:Uncharacterized protein n=1 Tax=Nitrospirillum iridis TaxID=765888 RepID=A0A7X0AZL7_9PROT|nr:hypothetical protein [Nitrospirillum iridis]MBB6253038.1 hypothetical protein [Nitrospirillum iridis]
MSKPLTGGSSDYYKVPIAHPATPGVAPYTAECLDIIEALDMTFAEGNAFKAIWRLAAARMGNGKPGNTALYDAEKVEFFGARMVAQAKPASSPPDDADEDGWRVPAAWLVTPDTFMGGPVTVPPPRP